MSIKEQIERGAALANLAELAANGAMNACNPTAVAAKIVRHTGVGVIVNENGVLTLGQAQLTLF